MGRGSAERGIIHVALTVISQPHLPHAHSFPDTDTHAYDHSPHQRRKLRKLFLLPIPPISIVCIPIPYLQHLLRVPFVHPSRPYPSLDIADHGRYEIAEDANGRGGEEVECCAADGGQGTKAWVADVRNGDAGWVKGRTGSVWL